MLQKELVEIQAAPPSLIGFIIKIRMICILSQNDIF